MRIVLLALSAAFMVVAPAVASDDAAVVSRVRKLVEAWNRNDAGALAASLSASPVIIDEYPPYHWQGPLALQDWSNDYAAMAELSGLTNPFVTLAAPSAVDVSGNSAYVVVPAVYSATHDSQIVHQKGVMTLALRRDSQDWRVTAFTWTRQ